MWALPCCPLFWAFYGTDFPRQAWNLCHRALINEVMLRGTKEQAAAGSQAAWRTNIVVCFVRNVNEVWTMTYVHLQLIATKQQRNQWPRTLGPFDEHVLKGSTCVLPRLSFSSASLSNSIHSLSLEVVEWVQKDPMGSGSGARLGLLIQTRFPSSCHRTMVIDLPHPTVWYIHLCLSKGSVKYVSILISSFPTICVVYFTKNILPRELWEQRYHLILVHFMSIASPGGLTSNDWKWDKVRYPWSNIRLEVGVILATEIMIIEVEVGVE